MSPLATARRRTSPTPIHHCSLRPLDGVKPLFILPDDPLAEEVLIPGFRGSQQVDCMVGFFSSRVLVSLAPGLATYIRNSENCLRLIISPLLRPEDKTAIEDGLKSRNDVASTAVNQLLITEDTIQQHTLKCLSWLLSTRRLEIKVALMQNALFHPKVWLFQCDDDTVAVHGSSNITYSGVRRNIEQVAVSKSWHGEAEHYVIAKLLQSFGQFWNDEHRDCIVLPMPTALRDQLVRTYCPPVAPTEDDLRRLFGRRGDKNAAESTRRPATSPDSRFAIPKGLRYTDGAFAHQGQAVSAWHATGGRGILEMATGSGKTIAALICAHGLYRRCTAPLLVVVAAPYIPLVDQWCAEIRSFGLRPCNMTAMSGAKERGRALQDIHRRMRHGLTSVEAVVVTHDTLCTRRFVEQIDRFDCALLLVADEVHNLGRASFVNNPPSCFQYRLGLSATPVRQYDEDGTEALRNYFGDVVFRFSLEDAIGVCLVEYDYHIHSVHLDSDEMDMWHALTATIGENSWRAERGKPDDYLARLLRERRRLLETARAKVPTLAARLEQEDMGDLRHTLIYTSDKAPGQLEEVNQLLRTKGIRFHQLTATETTSRSNTRKIIRAFRCGDVSVLTAKRVLDEGVDIPEISRAYVLASTTVERQWIQRRGRLLRKCHETGKAHSVIHDFVAVPRRMDRLVDRRGRQLVRSELLRVQEFARLARNADQPDGPQQVIDDLVEAAYL